MGGGGGKGIDIEESKKYSFISSSLDHFHNYHYSSAFALLVFFLVV